MARIVVGRQSSVVSHQSSVVGRRSSVVGRPSSVVLAAMLLFTVWFSAYSIRLHDAHRTHKADLGQIDLAIWNTAHGRFVQEIKDDQVSTRLTDHVEPIFLLVSLVFWLWDDVRALLILQAAALAAGAWPLYRLAERRMRDAAWGAAGGLSVSRAARIGALFAMAYLLMPALQAAAVAEFHALALAPVFVAWALWAVESGRWRQFVAAAVLLMSVQEGMALLAAMLGVYALARSLYREDAKMQRSTKKVDSLRALRFGGLMVNTPEALAGAAILILGLVWFYVTTFVIIPHYAAQVYGLAQTPYAARYGALGESFGDVLKSLVTRPGVALGVASEPARVQYLIRLLGATGFLALLGPEILLLSAPLLLANLFSSFAMQYFGELHYSAALTPYLILAAVVGLRRFTAQALPLGGLKAAVGVGLALLAAGALVSQADGGYTPAGRAYQRLGPGWPAVTAHEARLAHFARQIPRDAALTTTASLYPHLSHRPLIYQFPWLGQAAWALIDVTGATDRHPADIKREALQLLAAGWGVVDAADGYLLLARGRDEATIPDAFYDFARASASFGRFGPSGGPEFPLDITFNGRLKLLGYDLADEPRWRRTRIRLYWQPVAPLPEDTVVSVQMVSPDGTIVGDTALQPAPALLWYGPARWQPGETVVVNTLPMFLPVAWAPLIRVDAAGRRLAPHIAASPAAGQVSATSDGELLLPPWERQDGWLVPFSEPREKYPAAERFTGGGWSVRLTATAMRYGAAPGRSFPLALRWASDEGAAPRDYRVFVHLRDAAAGTVATGDATPTWFSQLPVNRWPAGFATWGAHAIPIPPDLAPGEYTLVIGWYDPETGKRLSASGPDGNATGNEIVLGKVVVNLLAGPRPDLACLIAPESCASQE
jgi:uncharacterized membrane protein